MLAVLSLQSTVCMHSIMLPMLLQSSFFTSRVLRYQPGGEIVQHMNTALQYQSNTACCIQVLLSCASALLQAVPISYVLTSCITWHSQNMQHTVLQMSEVAFAKAALHSASEKISQTAAVYAGRTEHLAQQLQAPFEWQPMAVHVVEAPTHLASLGLVPTHNKSASGAPLSFCLALLLNQQSLMLTTGSKLKELQC